MYEGVLVIARQKKSGQGRPCRIFSLHSGVSNQLTSNARYQ